MPCGLSCGDSYRVWIPEGSVELLHALIGTAEKPMNPYLAAGIVLTHKLVTSLSLSGWEEPPPKYTPDELEAIERRLSIFQQIANEEPDGEGTFHPSEAPQLERMLAGEALRELANRPWKYSDEIPSNWKECVATYLKAWIAQPDPLILLDLGELLVRVGHISKAKESFDVILLFPAFADSFYEGQDAPELVDDIVRSAKEHLQDLDQPQI